MIQLLIQISINFPDFIFLATFWHNLGRMAKLFALPNKKGY